jgi:hypothetical protein
VLDQSESASAPWHRLDLAVGAPPIRVDLQEHVLDAQGRALAMGDDQLGFPTAAIIAG